MRRILPRLAVLVLAVACFTGAPPVQSQEIFHPGGPTFELQDEGVVAGKINIIDCVGANIACTRSTLTGTVTISGGGSNHDLLDGSVAQDTVAAGASRGSLIYGNSTPKWAELVIGAANRVLTSDGTDAAWGQVPLATAVSGILPTANGGTGIAYFTAAGPSVARVYTFPDAAATMTITVASGAKALATGAISSAACTTAQTDTATGTATTDTIIVSFNGDPTAVTGYVPLTTGMLTIIPYPTANTVNFKVCNNSSASITPGAITLNWRVVR